MQALVPAGYMPAPIANGLPFVLCTGGFSGASFLVAEGGHTHHADHQQAHEHAGDDGERPLEWEFCPCGAVFGSAALIAEYHPPSPLLHKNPSATEIDGIVRSVATRPWRARAPPENEPIDA